MELELIQEAATATVVAIETQLGFDYGLIDEGIRDEVRDAAKSIRAYGQSFKGSMIQIGKRLIEVKGMLDYGQFGEWIEAEFDMSDRTARNFMNVARRYDGKTEIISVLSDTVLCLLAAPSTPEGARVEVEQAALSGAKVTVEQAKKAAAKFTEPKPAKPRAEVKRVAEPYEAPKPTPAKVVYVEPKPEATEQPQYAPYWKLLGAMRHWISGLVAEGDSPMLALTVLKRGRGTDAYRHSLVEYLRVAGIVYREGDLPRAIDELHQWHSRLKDAATPESSVEGAPDVEPTPDQLQWQAEQEDYEASLSSDELEAVALVAAEQAEEDAERAARDAARPSFENVPEPIVEAAPKPASMLTREWVVYVLIGYDPINADFKTALKAATPDDLREAMAGLTTEEKHWKARYKALVTRFDELMAPDPRIADAKNLIAILAQARAAAKADYGRLCGLHLDLVTYERVVESMTGRLQSLVANLESGKEVTK